MAFPHLPIHENNRDAAYRCSGIRSEIGFQCRFWEPLARTRMSAVLGAHSAAYLLNDYSGTQKEAGAKWGIDAGFIKAVI
jgi:hypothetical protein